MEENDLDADHASHYHEVKKSNDASEAPYAAWADVAGQQHEKGANVHSTADVDSRGQVDFLALARIEQLKYQREGSSYQRAKDGHASEAISTCHVYVASLTELLCHFFFVFIIN